MDVYRITHRDTGRCYVGSTIRTAPKRLREHCRHAFKVGTQTPLYAAMREFGLDAFDLEVLATATDYEHLLCLEMEAIAANNCVAPNGFSLVKGGRGNFGWKPSEETKRRISQKALGRPAHNKGVTATEEARKRVSLAQQARIEREREAGIVRVPWNRGVPATPEHRAKLSAAKRGRPMSESHKQAFRGKRHSPATCAKLSAIKREYHARKRSELNAQVGATMLPFDNLEPYKELNDA